MFLTDLHIHSTYSDGQLSIPEIVDFYGVRKFNIIAITDHLCEEESFLGKASRFLEKTLTNESFPFYLKLIEREAKRAMDEYGMLVIPGIEFTKNSLYFKRSAHIVALGITEFISADKNIDELLFEIKKQGGISIAAHPVSTRVLEHQTFHLWDQRENLRDKFDAWEVASGPYLFDEVMNSGLPMIANSDFHHPKQINSWKTMIDCELNFDSMASAIREQRIEFIKYSEYTSPVKLPGKVVGEGAHYQFSMS
ncbi:MAG: PHP domain-containing protein [Bdellovibrionales bacterium]|nr:PHP domain-containing protein [Bdellovibrionales bacterium]